MPFISLAKQEEYRKFIQELNGSWAPATQIYDDMVRGYVEILKNDRTLVRDVFILDVGCGAGGVLESWNPDAALKLGADPDFNSLIRHRDRRINLACADASYLPFASRTIDLIICSWVFEHLSSPFKTLSEMRRVLRDDGYIIFLTPSKLSPVAMLNRKLPAVYQSSLVKYVYGRVETDTFPVVYQANTIRDINLLANKAGLVVEEAILIDDPTYLAFNKLILYILLLFHRLLPKKFYVHIVGRLKRS